MKKLDHRWIGPFKILKVVSAAALKLQLTLKEKGIHPVVSVSNTRPYIPNDIPERPNDPRPGPDVVDGSEEYEVERILNSKHWRGRLVYLVKFKGGPPPSNEALPPATLAHPQRLIANSRPLPPAAIRDAPPLR